MKKNLLCIIVLLFTCFNVYSQQIGNGTASQISNFNTILPSGVYVTNQAQANYPLEVPTWPWKHLIVAKGNSTCEFQISTAFTHDDRVVFRKVVRDSNNPNANNAWYELATRGKNVFTDDQFIPFGKSFISGSTTDANRRLRLQFIGSASQGDSYIDYGGNLFFRSPKSNTTAIGFVRNADNTQVFLGHISDASKRLSLHYYEKASGGDAYVGNSGGQVYVRAGSSTPIAAFNSTGLLVMGRIKAKEIK